MARRFLCGILTLATALSMSSSLWAQTQSPSPSDPARVERRIAKLHDQLQITPAEEQLWSNVANVMRENARTMGQSYDQRHANLDSLDAVKNLRSYASAAELHARNMQRFATTFAKLYEAMPAAQKGIADQAIRARANRF